MTDLHRGQEPRRIAKWLQVARVAALVLIVVLAAGAPARSSIARLRIQKVSAGPFR